jgi:glycosyltransferase involved in cell wall biosynthesis
MMLEIAHLSAVHARDDARIFDKQCRTLAARGHRVSLVVADGLGDAWRDGVRIVDAGARGDGLNGLAAAGVRLPGWRRIDALGQLGRPGIGDLRGSSRAGLITPHATPGHPGAAPAMMFEYMAAGIPVIASDFPPWRAVVEAHACGLCVDPRDPPAIAAAIDYLAGHPDIARRMGGNGRKAVCARYNWPREASKLIQFYEHL